MLLTIYYHSCGAITPLIEDLLDIGVDILDPVQPLALDPRDLKARYGRQITFFGGVDVPWENIHAMYEAIKECHY